MCPESLHNAKHYFSPQFNSAEYGVCVFGKAHKRSDPSLRISLSPSSHATTTPSPTLPLNNSSHLKVAIVFLLQGVQVLLSGLGVVALGSLPTELLRVQRPPHLGVDEVDRSAGPRVKNAGRVLLGNAVQCTVIAQCQYNSPTIF